MRAVMTKADLQRTKHARSSFVPCRTLPVRSIGEAKNGLIQSRILNAHGKASFEVRNQPHPFCHIAARQITLQSKAQRINFSSWKQFFCRHREDRNQRSTPPRRSSIYSCFDEGLTYNSIYQCHEWEWLRELCTIWASSIFSWRIAGLQASDVYLWKARETVDHRRRVFLLSVVLKRNLFLRFHGTCWCVFLCVRRKMVETVTEQFSDFTLKLRTRLFCVIFLVRGEWKVTWESNRGQSRRRVSDFLDEKWREFVECFTSWLMNLKLREIGEFDC